ncbi:MAG: hypothetical protein ACE14T_11050 [Syntrophales bacterium]
MVIKMPIKFHGNYVVIIRSPGSEARERCQKLTVRELSGEEKERSYPGVASADLPTHQVTFYDFGCKRIIEGKLKTNSEDRVVFSVREKEYEFAPFVPKKG